MEETWKRQLFSLSFFLPSLPFFFFFSLKKEETREREKIPFRDSSRVTRNSLLQRRRRRRGEKEEVPQHRESVVEKKRERERQATLVDETQALSVSHSKFSFPTSVLSPPRLDLQLQG